MHCRLTRNLSAQAAWVLITLLVLLEEITTNPSGRPSGILPRHFMKRSFFEIQCKGVYDKSIFAKVDSICEDCYNLFREPQLHNLCRKNCFTTDYFKGCLETLQLSDQEEEIQLWIKQLHGADIGGIGPDASHPNTS